MFGFLFKKRPPSDPPTDKQRRYAAHLGVTVTTTMSKWDLFAVIAEAERKNPKAAEQREHIKAKSRVRKFGQELIDQEAHWNRFADSRAYVLAVYKHRNETIVDVLMVNQASITARGKLKLAVAAPKVVKDRYIGKYLEWDRDFELPIESLIYHEPLSPNFYEHDRDGFALANRTYQRNIERGLKIARRL